MSLRGLLAGPALAAGAIGLVAALVPLSAGATGTSPASAAATKRTLARPRCSTAGLVVWLDTRGSGAAGSIYYTLELTNLSGHACTLYGYPGVSAVDLRGRRLGSAATRNTHAHHVVVLAPRAAATAVLQIVQAANFPRSTCRQVTAAGLRVYPPGQTRSKIVPFPFRACSRRGPVYLTVRPVG
jgi:Domain of unknown function (DUF4232)